jgi:hypothetical protein
MSGGSMDYLNGENRMIVSADHEANHIADVLDMVEIDALSRALTNHEEKQK